MSIIRLAFMLLCITNISFAESNTPLTLSPENKKLLNDENGIAVLLMKIQNKKLKETWYKIRCEAVGTNFKCAMDTMKSGFTGFLFSNGVHLLATKKCDWNPRVLQIRIENDLIWKNSSLMYPDVFEEAPVRVHRNDNITMCQWIKFVSSDLWKDHFNYHHLLIHVRANEKFTGSEFHKVGVAVTQFRETGLALRNNLNDYYEKLDQKTKDTRYPKGKSDLYSYFAGVMVRTYRLACYYERSLQYTIQRELRRTYENGTRFFLSTALNNSMPTWYIDQEQLDMLNIVQRTQGFTKPEDFFFVSKNITNVKGQQVVLPAFTNCGSEPVELEY